MVTITTDRQALAKTNMFGGYSNRHGYLDNRQAGLNIQHVWKLSNRHGYLDNMQALTTNMCHLGKSKIPSAGKVDQLEIMSNE